MATMVVQDAMFAGTTQLPKMLVVYTDSLFADDVISQIETIRKYHQVDPELVRYDPTGKHGLTVEQLVARARDPEKPIAMVLSGHAHEEHFYGAEIAKRLKHGEPAFAGPVAIQVMHAPEDADRFAIKHSDAIGIFDGGVPVSKNFAKADGTLERRGNPEHPFAILADAYHHTRTSLYQGKLVLPKLVVIDADPNFCKIVNHQSIQCQIEYGMKVEALHYDAKGTDGLTAEQIIQRVNDAPVDMVLTGNTYQQAPYGREIAAGLTQGERPFKGLIAIQTADAPTAEDKTLALACGVTHVFSKDEAPLHDGQRNDASSFARIKAEYDVQHPRSPVTSYPR